MSFAEQGALGGIVYLFLSLACPLAGELRLALLAAVAKVTLTRIAHAGYLFKHYNIKMVMALALTCNSLATFLLALTPG